MKKVILVGDGMGDYPVDLLGGKTPLQAADTPHMRRIAAAGRVHFTRTIPEGMPTGSDVANLGLLGYDATVNYTGRAPIEAAGANIKLGADDIAYRCNLVTLKEGLMEDYSAGHITTEEAHRLIADIDTQVGGVGLRFYGGVSYRHLLVWRNGPEELETTAPHDFTGKPVGDHLPRGERAQEVKDLMCHGRDVLANHPVNQARIREGKHPATHIWLWGQGRTLELASYKTLYGLTGGVISAVDLVRGLGILAGLEAPVIPGATGFVDTNYAGKVSAALKILEEHDFVYVHVEAPDECGHIGDAKLKTEAIEAFDREIVGPMWKALENMGTPYRLLVCMDHRTPVATRTHTTEPVPLAVLDGPVGPVSQEQPFDESIGGTEPDSVSHEVVRTALRGA